VGFVFVVIGGLFGLLLVLNGLLQAARRSAKIGFWHTLLAFLAALLPLAGVIRAAQFGPANPLLERGALLIGGVLVVSGLIIALIEVFRPERLKASRGILSIGAGGLLIATTLIVPGVSQNVLQPALATATPISIAAVRATATDIPDETAWPEASPTLTPTPSPTATLTATRVQPSPTPTATRFRFATRTPEPTPTLPNPCLALTRFNVNLRTLPDLDAEVLVVIPFDTTVTLFGRNDDSSWWLAQHEGQTGWLKGEFLNVTTSCAELSVREG
jgi:hypothetical protein